MNTADDNWNATAAQHGATALRKSVQHGANPGHSFEQYEAAKPHSTGRLEEGTWADVTPLPRRARFDHEAGAPIEAVPAIGWES